MIAAEVVARESAAWVWYPEQARVVDTDEYLLVRWPAWFERDAAVLRFQPHRPPADVLDEIADRTRRLGGRTLTFVQRLGAPVAHEALVRERGGALIETVDVLARPLDTLPDLDPPDDVEVRWMLDLETVVDAHRVSIAAFEEGEMPPPARLEEIVDEESATLAAGTGGRVVAYLAGAAVGTLGLTIAGTTARLWDAGTLPAARHRGVFRACLDDALAYAAAHGATMALTKGVVTTSAPTFRRAGFTAYGEERTYLLTV